MIFTGEYERVIDAKNRLQIPAQVRGVMDSKRDGASFYLVPGSRPGTLSLYPEKLFEAMAEAVGSELVEDDDAAVFQQLYFSQACRLEVDVQGRVLLHDKVLARAGIGKEVFLTGARDHLDLWNQKDFEEFRESHYSRLKELRKKAAPLLSRERGLKDG